MQNLLQEPDKPFLDKLADNYPLWADYTYYFEQAPEGKEITTFDLCLLPALTACGYERLPSSVTFNLLSKQLLINNEFTDTSKGQYSNPSIAIVFLNHQGKLRAMHAGVVIPDTQLIIDIPDYGSPARVMFLNEVVDDYKKMYYHNDSLPRIHTQYVNTDTLSRYFMTLDTL